MRNGKKSEENPAALLPILVFLVLYLGMGLIFEYGMGIQMAFYDIPYTLLVIGCQIGNLVEGEPQNVGIA